MSDAFTLSAWLTNSSTVPSAAKYVTFTVPVWPMRYARSSACQWFAGTQSRSLNTTCRAAVRLSPTPPAIEVRDEHAHATDRSGTGPRASGAAPRRLAGERHRRVAEVCGDPLHRLVEGAEDDHLLALRDGALHELDRRPHLRARDLLARLREVGEQLHAVLPPTRVAQARRGRHSSVRHHSLRRRAPLERAREQRLEHAPHLLASGALGHRHGQPRAQLGRQVEHLVLRAAEHDAVELDAQLLEVARAVGDPAVAVVAARRSSAWRTRGSSAPSDARRAGAAGRGRAGGS